MTNLATRVLETRATLERIAAGFSPAVFASSLAAEDMVLTDMILKANLPIAIFSLETGRLLEVYVRERIEGERFIDTVNRIGVAPFKEYVYASPIKGGQLVGEDEYA